MRACTASRATRRSSWRTAARSRSPTCSRATRLRNGSRRGTYRRYVATTVLDHWSTVKPAYRVTLEDGTELDRQRRPPLPHRREAGSTSTGSEAGRDRRPHLTPNDKLMGTGAFAVAPRARAGLPARLPLRMVRGDGLLGVVRPTSGPRRSHGRAPLPPGADRPGGASARAGLPRRDRTSRRRSSCSPPCGAVGREAIARSQLARRRRAAIGELIAWPTPGERLSGARVPGGDLRRRGQLHSGASSGSRTPIRDHRLDACDAFGGSGFTLTSSRTAAGRTG